MLEIEKYGDQSFEEVFNYVVKQIKLQSKDWNNLELADPGITLLEMFSWLKSKQLDRCNVISKDTLYQFLRLLDVKLENNKPSRTFIKIGNVQHNVIIPEGTKWNTDNNIIFENEAPLVVSMTDVVKVCFESIEDDIEKGIMDFNGSKAYYMFGENLKYSNRISPTVTICLDAPIVKNIWLNMFFDVDSQASKERNPVTVKDDFVEMADIQWEYYGTLNGKTGWHKIEFVIDRTHKFLFSDIISFRIMGEMQKMGDTYKIRATLNSAEYDYPPMLKRLATNVFPVVQKDTICENKIFKGREVYNYTVDLKTYLGLYGDHVVYVSEEDSWVPVEDFSTTIDIKSGIKTFDLSVVKDKLDNVNDARNAVMIVSYQKEKLPGLKTVISSSGGYASQAIKYFDCEDVCYEDFDLIIGKVENSQVSYDLWKKVETLFSSSKYDKHYILDWENDEIRFGNNEMGKAPDKLENGIRIAGYSKTLGQRGNIKSNQIKFAESKNKDITSLEIQQLTPAIGGRDSVTLSELKNRPSRAFSDATRAVTYDDYEQIIKKTPGLVINNIKILPGYLPKGNDTDMNCVTVAIHQGNKIIEARSFNNYKKNILRHLDKYRLINTKIDVVASSHVGLKISGDVLFHGFQADIKESLHEHIYEFIEKLNSELGRTLYFGDLFGVIERTKGVVRLQNLNFEPMGDYKDITKSGDIIVKPNGCYHIEKMAFNFLSSLDL